jgi:hypothetical protein
MRGEAGGCFRAEDADEVLAAEPMTGLDLTELSFLEEHERCDANRDGG